MAGMNKSFNQLPVQASDFVGVGDNNIVQAGDNLLYVDKNFKMPKSEKGEASGMTTLGGGGARITDFASAKNETMNMLGFGDRYGPDEDGFDFPDKGFENDYASNNGSATSISPVHLFDLTTTLLENRE